MPVVLVLSEVFLLLCWCSVIGGDVRFAAINPTRKQFAGRGSIGVLTEMQHDASHGSIIIMIKGIYVCCIL